MPKRRSKDPVEVLAQRVLNAPQVRDAINQFQDLLDRAGNVIDTIDGLPRPKGPQPVPPYQPPPPRAEPEPAPPPAPDDPRVVLAFAQDAVLTREIVKERRNALAAICHPDKGGSDAAMQKILQAAEELLAKLPG